MNGCRARASGRRQRNNKSREPHSSSSQGKPLTNSRHAATSQRYSLDGQENQHSTNVPTLLASQPARRKRSDAKVLLVPVTGQPKKKRKIK
jgi:hypothetical protein